MREVKADGVPLRPPLAARGASDGRGGGVRIGGYRTGEVGAFPPSCIADVERSRMSEEFEAEGELGLDAEFGAGDGVVVEGLRGGVEVDDADADGDAG